MKEKKEIQIAWEIWNLINRLNDLLWERYDDPFLQICSQEEHEKWRRTITPPKEQEEDPPF